MREALRDLWQRDPLGLAAIGAFALFLAAAVLAPWIAPYDPLSQLDLSEGKLLGPTAQHWLGTDNLSRDILSRILYGARMSLTTGLLAMSVAISLGTLIGGLAGFLGGKIDALLMRAVDVLLCIPQLVLLLVVLGLLPYERGFLATALVLGCSSWMGTSRLVRAQALAIKEREFVQAGRALGASRWRILARHVLPNCLAPITVSAGLSLSGAILWESSLAYLGLGAPPPTPSWGGMVAEGIPYLWSHPWVAVFPGLAVLGTVFCVNLAVDAFGGYSFTPNRFTRISRNS